MTPVRLQPAASWSRVKHSTTGPLRSLKDSVDHDIIQTAFKESVDIDKIQTAFKDSVDHDKIQNAF